MTLEDRIESFVRLKSIIENQSEADRANLFTKATSQNPWFTHENIELALQGVAKFLDKKNLTEWASPYVLQSEKSNKRVGVAMAGNIPLVGFHDLLCVLIFGHVLVAKLSSQDTVLMEFICNQLKQIDLRFRELIFIEEKLTNIDAVIATGSDNTGRYFEYYFRNIPHIIRKNRTSCAVIRGEENEAQLKELGKDVFSYFGQGCRNVSKLFLPAGYDVKKIMKAWEEYGALVNHNKYANNYHYQHSILLINLIHFFDNGSVILTESKSLVSPIAIVYYEFYSDLTQLEKRLNENKEKIQCVASADRWYPKSVAFGETQTPGLSDYADEVNTLKFLASMT
ncbi:MAG: acyl-CoA reductase [Cytophagales bacterium]|nr:acyl-CoA reductase [Cytophagales bacterium]MCA6373424.1 acyl-CoA reductase [Cytophagales bacterium]MCA6377954.1 acyl-CoA reductase [Cytophagales bacterium]MCA6382893.1 acyl-CoA reductase [Cytophagales bacterium]